nr:ATP synthase F0 subunit 6 [Stomphastis sp.]UYL25743.1 ATP synthase F0 subunit 6 [Stomphastis sp.]UYL25756.1 ATP synthase F0 subunit 6 [Stomphastis sp.]UYL25769.1 ATP synthase F0 subunit 6 [Stomphastis sp.]UYL25782.1 ATP synthase F0 subunit 6 [Stomphastis sp.]
MMSNLFSIFDPSTNIFSLSLNWLSTILGLMFLPFYYWLIPNRHSFLWNFIINKLHNEFKILIGLKNTNGSTLIFISIFSFILFNNILGIFPYIFTSTSHLILALSISLPLWISFMLYGWINHNEHMFSHLIPQGTPAILMPFMVLIETISNIIRPGTLAVRLTANMIAGHLLLTLLSGTGVMIPTSMIYFLIMIQFLLLTLESAVAIIQSYVISILSTLYSSETNYEKY